MSIPLINCEPHQHHEKHLCGLVERKQMLAVAQLAKNGRYICAMCGRVAASSENLCSPVELDKVE